MKTIYKIALASGQDSAVDRPCEHTPMKWGFIISRHRKDPEDEGLEIVDAFQGNWSHYLYDTREEALDKARERIKKDRERESTLSETPATGN